MDYKALNNKGAKVKATVQPASDVPSSERSRSGFGRLSRGEQFVYARRRRNDWQAVIREALFEIDILASAVEATAREVASSPRLIKKWDDDLGDYRPMALEDKGPTDRLVRSIYRKHTMAIRGTRFAERLWYVMESIGELWSIEHEGKFYLAQSTALTWHEDGSGADWARYGPNSASKVVVRVPIDKIHRVFNPDVEYDLDAWSPFRAVVSAIEQFQLANDLIAASLGEKLYTAPILWIPDDEEGTAFEQYKTANETMRKGMTQGKQRSLLGQTEITRAPFVMSSEVAPEYVMVGGDLNKELFELTDRLTKQIARASGQPVNALLDGVGAASQWSSLMEARNHFTYEIGPRADMLCDAMTGILLTPFLPEEAQDQYIIGHDISKLVNAQVLPAEVRQAYMVGAVDRRCVAESVGKEVRKLPDGMTEQEQWLLNHSSTSLQQDAVAAVDLNEGDTVDLMSDITNQDGPQESGGLSVAASFADDSWIVSSAYR